MRLNGKQIEQLHGAMLKAFPDEFSLRFLVTTRLDQNLAEIAPKSGVAETVFELIQWANTQGQVEQLIQNALDLNPGNEDLHACAAILLQVSHAPQNTNCSTTDSLNNNDPLNRQYTANPFVWRGPITEAEAFFDRDRERQQIRDMLAKRQNCQIVAERRMGKTSLLWQIAREAADWNSNTVMALMELHNPACYTLNGFLGYSGRQFGWPTCPTTLIEFAENVEAMCGQGVHPIMFIDEFEEFLIRRDTFTRDFFATMRYLCGKGMSIITTSRQPLSKLTDPHDPTSPFYNIFYLLALTVFNQEDAEDFVSLSRPNIVPFTQQEREHILVFARNHPLALQVACYHLIEARRENAALADAIQQANDELNVLLPFF